MNLQFYFEKLIASEEFRKFKDENPEAYLCSGFIVIDKEQGKNQIHLDYYVPPQSIENSHSHARESKIIKENSSVNDISAEDSGEAESGAINNREKRGNIFSFHLQGNVEKVPIECINDQIPTKVGDGIDFEFDKIEKLITNEMIYNNIDKKIQKILLSLQNVEGKDCLIGTVFISGLGMIKIKIDLEEIKITDFEKKSFMDIIRKK
ncbi:MAG: hypothetical protein ABIB79_05035 [archaeon]